MPDNHLNLIAKMTPVERKALLLQLTEKKQAQLRKVPLSFAQQRLWFLQQFEPESSFYTIPLALTIEGLLDRSILIDAIQEIVARHEVLRTTIDMIQEQPTQVIAPYLEIPLSFHDLSTLSETQQATEIQQLVQEEAQCPFHLSKEPLIRMVLLRQDQNHHVFLLTMHHIVSDGWSIKVFMQELSVLYQAFSQKLPSPLPPLPIQYADFTLWQRQSLQASTLEKQQAYWCQQLEGAPTLLSLPTDFPRPAIQTFQGARISFVLPPALSAQIKTFSQQHQTTVFMTILAVFYVFLYRYSGQEDLVVGTPIANRTRTEVEPLIGFFVNTLALRTKLAAHLGFLEVLSRVRETCVNAYNYQDLPFEQLIEALQPERSLSHTPLFQVMFGQQNNTIDEIHIPGLSFAPLTRHSSTSKFDLTMDITETPQGVKCVVEYSIDLFTSETIQRMITHFQQIVISLLENPVRPICASPLLTVQECQSMLIDWNQTDVPPPTTTGIHQLFEAQVERSPEAEAVVYQQERLSYRELNNEANRLARYLRTQGVGSETCVGLYLERSLFQMIAVLATLKAGGTYLPLDPAYPSDRLTFMLEDAQVAVLVTQHSLQNRFSDQEIPLVLVEACEEINTENLHLPIQPDQLAFMIYTSGSTGTPKGAMVTHANLINYTYFFSHRYQLPSLIHAHLLMASFSFDVFIADMVRSLCNGAKLVMVPYETVLAPEQLYALMLQEDIDSAEFVPAVLKSLADYLEQTQQTLSFMHLLAAGADTWPVRDYHQVLRLCSMETRVLNVYGLTEATIDNAHFERGEPLGSVEGAVPIGKPIANTQLYILNQALQPVPIGVMGELYVGGRGVGRGYLRRPDLTADRFIPDPFSALPGARLYCTGDVVRYRADGTIEFFGRSDQQVKIHGFRIELGEIEGTLVQHPTVREALVLAREDKSGEKKLVAYLTQRVHDESPLWRELTTRAIWNNEQVGEWQIVFEDLYSPDRVINIDELDAQIGWNSSYTDRRLPAEEVNEWVDTTVERFLAEHPSRVLETGCGSGLLFPRIAPSCTLYWGTDFSNAALDYAREQLRTIQPPLPQVILHQRMADDFSAITAETFDSMLMASVTQYFPNIDYLYHVIENMVQRLIPGGFIFIADVRNLLLLEAFHTSVQTYRAPDTFTREQLQIRIRQNMAQEKQLVVDPSFFHALQSRLPQITSVSLWLRRGNYRNELTNYRYDVVLRVGGEGVNTSSTLTPENSYIDWSQHQLTLKDIREHLTQQSPRRLILKRVPNARIWFDVQTTKLLKDPTGPSTVGAIRAILHTMKNPGIDPEEVWALGHDLPYTVDITWSDQDTTGAFDVVFQHHTKETLYTQDKIITNLGQEPVNSQSWSIYANNPLHSKINRELLSQLRRYIEERLPKYMVPAAFVLLENFPLTPNGKIDRRVLPPPGRNRPELEERYVEPRTPIEERIATIWCETLGLDQVGIFDNFFALGGHSLLATRLVFQINRAFQVDISLRVLFTTPTIAALATTVNSLLQGTYRQAAPQESIDLTKEVLLAPEIDVAQKPIRKLGIPTAVLLTGATGFIGAYLLAELLQATPANVYCLLRASSMDDAHRKIQQTLQSYLLWQEDFHTRIVPVIGDLAKFHFGLMPTQFQQLAQHIDAIYHCGAWVNFIYPYHMLKPTNVLGTQEVLRLASLDEIKPVHFVSTLSVFPLESQTPSMFYENDPLADPSHLANGYEQTKWVADKLFMVAQTRGIPISIYRPGLIGGHSQTGIVNLKDMLWSQLKGCIQMQSAPLVDIRLDITSVDYVCQAIVHLSMQSESAGKAFHLCNHRPASWNALIDQAHAYGYTFKTLSYGDWVGALQRITQFSEENALTPFMSALKKERSSTHPAIFDDSHTQSALAHTEIVCPATDQLFSSYLAYLVRSGFLPPHIH
jgi:amino acid adenylation domain-containing protein/thioester reductase-like protein